MDLTITPLPTHSSGASHHLTNGESSAHLWTQNTPLLNNSPVATLGTLENPTQPFLQACVQWCRNNIPHRSLLGPMDGNTWRSHRLVTWSDGSPPFAMEPSTPAHWTDLFISSGFQILSTYSSSLVDLTNSPPPSPKITERLLRNGTTICPLDPDHFQRDLSAIHALSLRSFSNNFLYTPIPLDAFLAMYQRIQPLINPAYILLAERENALTGFVFALPDPLALQANLPPLLIVKTLAVAPESTSAGLGSHLVNLVQHHALSNNITTAIHALKHSNNSSQKISTRHHAADLRHYALMAINLK